VVVAEPIVSVAVKLSALKEMVALVCARHITDC